nr:glycosyltransferase family 2 protein [Mucilaginibacter sp. JXJ CY 39]
MPFYKDRYILDALQAIEKQTNQNFTVYIGDDNSPNSIQRALDSVSDEFRKKIVYHRFTDNLGGKSLTKQWERCINLSSDEPYIWLFSDDDLMPADAVDRFYQFIGDAYSSDKDLIRFNVQIIDDNGTIIRPAQPHPHFETAESFLTRRLTGTCISSACEYIFSRRIYIEKNGFVEFPLAWCADDAAWINFSEQTGIYTIGGAPASWRMGGFNISSDKTSSYKLKIQACIEFLKFAEQKFSIDPHIKIDWLFGHLGLLNQTQKVKFYFHNALLSSGLFEKTFVVKTIVSRSVAKVNEKAKKAFSKVTGQPKQLS